MPEKSSDYRVAVFGAGGVGKSSLVLRFMKGMFHEGYVSTVEDNYQLLISCGKSICTLQVTDTAGSYQFPAMQRLTISRGHAFILVYSVVSQQTLQQLWPIYEQICDIKGSDMQYVPVVLVGNKNDEANREVPTEDGMVLAARWKCCFMETSAKMDYNVQEMFKKLLTMEKRRAVSLRVDNKKAKGTWPRLKGKCSMM